MNNETNDLLKKILSSIGDLCFFAFFLIIIQITSCMELDNIKHAIKTEQTK